MDYPLKGLRVLDFSRVLAGPYASRMLADLGAEVLKVEPPEGDMTRLLGQRMGSSSSYYVQHNVGKRNICIDLKAEGAAELAQALVRQADIVIENFRPGVMARLGLGWDTLQAINPRLVMLSISGYGQHGPERDRGAFAPLLHAESGLMARQSTAHGGATADLTLSLADSFSALHGLVAVMAALHHVARTGEGQYIDMAMLNALHASDDYANLALLDGWTPTRQSHLCRVWDAPEGARIAIAGPVRVLWPALAPAGGLEDPAPEGAGETEQDTLRSPLLQAYLLSFDTFDALTAQLDAARLHWGRVRGPGRDAYQTPSIEAREVLVKVTGEDGGEVTTVQSPYRFSGLGSGVAPGARTPATGEDNAAVLRDWLGYDADTVAGLCDRDILLGTAGTR